MNPYAGMQIYEDRALGDSQAAFVTVPRPISWHEYTYLKDNQRDDCVNDFRFLFQLQPQPQPRKPSMNLSASVMLVEDSIRPARVEYDPDNSRNNNPSKFFKCLDSTIQKGDLVIVTTSTRHGMTVAKDEAIGYEDVPVDFDAVEPWGWIVGPIPTAQHKAILETEKAIIGKVSQANANKMKTELKAAMGLDTVSFQGLDLTKAGAALPAPDAPKGADAPVDQSFVAPDLRTPEA